MTDFYIIMCFFVSGMCDGKCGHGMDNYFLVLMMMCQYNINRYKSGTIVCGILLI